jgi:ABC-type tungstate transport system permease subunit
MKRRNILQCLSLLSVSLAGTRVFSAPASKASSPEVPASPLTASPLIADSHDTIKPEQVYPLGSRDPVQIRVGNGGAGQAGLVEVLATDYVNFKGGGFAVAWYKSDTTVTLDYLKRRIVDVGLVYDAQLELQAVREGYATGLSFVFKDHFWIVGPADNNSAQLDESDTAETAFLKIAKTGSPTGNPSDGSVFLSRNDRSATHIKEQKIFQSVSLNPPFSGQEKWYYKMTGDTFPAAAIKLANDSGYYTLTDKGTWLANLENTNRLKPYVQGSDELDDVLLNPCDVLLANTPTGTSEEAMDFLRYLLSPRGQAVIADFKKHDQQLYTPVLLNS